MYRSAGYRTARRKRQLVRAARRVVFDNDILSSRNLIPYHAGRRKMQHRISGVLSRPRAATGHKNRSFVGHMALDSRRHIIHEKRIERRTKRRSGWSTASISLRRMAGSSEIQEITVGIAGSGHECTDLPGQSYAAAAEVHQRMFTIQKPTGVDF